MTSKGDAASLNSPIPILRTLAELREWRRARFARGATVGFVPTMGALHSGHLNLVRASLAETDETIVSVYVNPAQFAPHEDFGSYPRTLPTDIQALVSLTTSADDASTAPARSKLISAIFAPTTDQLYPNGIERDKSKQRGAFVEVADLQDRMEGASRPTFFRGVATVVTKLFNAVQPDLAYFGQKDIQQAILLRRMVSDLLFPHPPGPSAVRVLPTSRAEDGLALSSRNAYLTPASRKHATALHDALQRGQDAWTSGSPPAKVLETARSHVAHAATLSARDNVHIELLYISLNDPHTLETISDSPDRSQLSGAILSGAAMISEGKDGQKTRLIDNLLLDFSLQ
ncbi:pantoate-beta-alanine ligase [Ceraceosorus bombacis]|uniref:Pantoate--beta-alanine ligase n=1 Tax=Ceraceosorus bombacis TaxID=401625 RepID=A0A0P1BBC0_9BASI|nr:pantoate-beta-alanine ligase [Ceraceosorus bombacis]